MTRSCASADGPRDEMCQSEFCQLLYSRVGTSCTTNQEQIEVMELKGYIQPTCTRPTLCIQSRQARPWTTSADHTVDLPWPKFSSPEYGAKFQREVTLILEILEFPYNTV